MSVSITSHCAVFQCLTRFKYINLFQISTWNNTSPPNPACWPMLSHQCASVNPGFFCAHRRWHYSDRHHVHSRIGSVSITNGTEVSLKEDTEEEDYHSKLWDMTEISFCLYLFDHENMVKMKFKELLITVSKHWDFQFSFCLIHFLKSHIYFILVLVKI